MLPKTMVNLDWRVPSGGYPENPVFMPGHVEIAPFCFQVKAIRFQDGYRLLDHGATGRVVSLDAVVCGRDWSPYGPKGTPLPLTFNHPHTFATDHEAARDLLLRALRHEVDECLLVNGVRVNDPHANGRQGI